MRERGLLILSSGFASVVTILTGALMARTLTKSAFGTYQQALLVFSVLSVVASLGTQKAILYFVSSVQSCQRRRLTRILGVATLGGFVTAAILAATWRALCSSFHNPDLEPLLGLVIANLIARCLTESLAAVAVSTGRTPVVYWTTFAGALYSLGSTWTLSLLSMGPTAFLAAVTVLELLRLVVLGVLVVTAAGGEEDGSRLTTADLAKYLAPLVGAVVTLLLVKRMDALLVSWLTTPAAYALYSRGALELPFSSVVTMNIAITAMPQIVRAHLTGDRGTIRRAFAADSFYASLVIIPWFTALFIWADDVVVLLYGPQYIGSAGVLRVYLTLAPLQFYAFDTVLQALNKTSTVLLCAFASLAVTVVLGVVLLDVMGPIGAAVALMVGTATSSTIYLQRIGREVGTPLRRLLPWAEWARVGLLSVGGAMVSIGVSRLLPSGLPLFLAVSINLSVSLVAQAALIWRFGPLSDSLRASVLGACREVLRSCTRRDLPRAPAS